MSDVFWAALISGGAALIATWLTNRFNGRLTAKQLDHLTEESARHWQRAEATRKDEQARNDMLRQADLRASRLREFWGHVLTSEAEVIKWVMWVKGGRKGRSPDRSVETMPSRPALLAYSVALLGLPEVYPQARDYFRATAHLEGAIDSDETKFDAVHEDWDQAFIYLERKIGDLTGATETVSDLILKSPPKAPQDGRARA